MNPYIETAENNLIHTYNRYPVVFDRGEGVYLYDTQGKKYLDFGAGIAVFALGYHNEEYNQALKHQIDKLIHTSNLFYNQPMAEAAQKLVKASGMSRVFFCSSGTEAIEGALKLARKYTWQKGQKDRTDIIAMNHSFHGRSTGALAVTGNKKYREPFEPLMGGVSFGEFNDLESVKKLVTDKTCAIIMEPVQGEGGIYPAKEEFIKGIRRLCDEWDILLIFDEIQCGMGRTGTMFAYQGYGVMPDVLTTAKALGCGVPVGAFLAGEKVSGVLQPGDHGTTYGGNPLAMAAVSRVLDLYEKQNILSHVNETAPYLEQKLNSLAAQYSFVKERRGRGLMQGLELSVPAADIINKALEMGLVLILAGPHIIRFVPPLIIEKEHIDEMIGILETIFSSIE